MLSRNPEFKSYVEQKIRANKFVKHLDFHFTKIEPGLIEGEAPFAEFLQQQDGYVHGGVTSTVADMVMGFASYSLVEQGQKVMTVEIKVSYYNRGIGQRIFGRGIVTKPGKRFHFCEAEVYVENEGSLNLIAKATCTMAIIDK